MLEFPPVTEELVRRYDVPAPRYTSYPTAPVWTEAIGPAAYAEALENAAKRHPEPLSLYVHIPFCRERCAFCGCNVVIARRRETADRYLAALAREMDTVASHLEERRGLSQIHWGGGTPTFLDEHQLETLWTAITSRFQPLPGAEIAVEIDPVVTSPAQLTLLRSFGFNRLSMGVQDFDPDVQRAIHRVQSVDETRAILEQARSLGFQGINFDLIWGLPLQTPASWSRTLEQVLELGPDRVALYSFAFVPELKPHQKRLPLSQIPQGTRKLELFRMAWLAFVGAGYRPIGMDHFALPEDELSLAQQWRALTRNFQGYTVKAATDVVALGASGISDVGGLYAQNAHALSPYESAALAGKLATERGFFLSPEDLRRKAIITQIMCNFFVDLGADGPSEFEPEMEKLRELEEQGLVLVRGSEIELTPRGRIFVRNVASLFDAYLGKQRVPFSRSV